MPKHRRISEKARTFIGNVRTLTIMHEKHRNIHFFAVAGAGICDRAPSSLSQRPLRGTVALRVGKSQGYDSSSADLAVHRHVALMDFHD